MSRFITPESATGPSLAQLMPDSKRMRTLRLSMLGLGFLTALGTTSARADARAAGQGAASAALVKGDQQGALAAADAALAQFPDDFFLLYNRGAALAGLGRTDEAIETLQRAEATAPDARWKSLSIYQRAIAFRDGGRCSEAAAEYKKFAELVQPTDPQAATMATNYAATCRSPSERKNVSGEEPATAPPPAKKPTAPPPKK
jgi:tetratricopeptide (TPR) repeat protein